MAEYIERGAALVALSSEGITKNMRGYRKVQAVPAADVAQVRYGVPMLAMRTERLEVYDYAGMLDGKEVFKRRIIAVEQSSMYCPFCGKRLCSRFFNYCPNCGAKMDEKETEE